LKLLPLGLNLADVALIADRPSVVKSRDDVKIDLARIIHAPMSANQSHDFITTAAELGTSIVIHRLNKPEEQKYLVELALKRKKNGRIWISVGLQDWTERCVLNRERIMDGSLGVCVDVANSHSVYVQEVLKNICEVYPGLKNTQKLMTGNINSVEGFLFSQKYAGIVRVGIGNGAACSTTDRTGYSSQGNFSLLKELYELPIRDADIIFDGGLKTSADFAKAFLGGADWCMSGGYFSRAKETNTNFFYGGASSEAKKLSGISMDYIEGKVLGVDNKVPMHVLVKELKDGLASAVSYCGYESLGKSIGNGTFQRLK